MLAWRDEIQGNLYDLNNRRVWWGIAYLWFERHDGETVFVLRYVMVIHDNQIAAYRTSDSVRSDLS